MLGTLSMSPTNNHNNNNNQHHLNDLDERFELLNFELEEKLKEMENIEEMLKLISKYETVRMIHMKDNYDLFMMKIRACPLQKYKRNRGNAVYPPIKFEIDT